MRLLAVTPGAEPVGQLVRMLARAAPQDPERARSLASLPAACQRLAGLVAVFDGGDAAGAAPEELRACLVRGPRRTGGELGGRG
ncbi:DUF6183 family protein [Kitasatospora sp. NPDC059463]|uniref:DUF6183 family protein n=1 Tax=Kitasatospora sp. NPDC059463 TaxID=3346842 RepID=UPI003694B038